MTVAGLLTLFGAGLGRVSLRLSPTLNPWATHPDVAGSRTAAYLLRDAKDNSTPAVLRFNGAAV